MFRKNERHRQQSFFSGEQLLPERLQARLVSSWAETFYQELFCRIEEELFAPLYSEEASRPNVPVNVLMGSEILKCGYGWSDEELYEQVCFNLQVRHALGLQDLGCEIFRLRTLYNFRRRVREYVEKSGVNLVEKVFEQVTDEQLGAVALATGWQRMDSTQVLSNLAKMTRLELLVAVLQKVHRQLPESLQERWTQDWARYLEGRPHQVCYKVAAAEVEEHQVRIGQELCAVEAVLAQQAPESEVLALVQRVLEEQYERREDGAVTLRPPEEVSADSLQSPHDPDATYHVKGGATYCGGYVANVSETADPANPVQMITDVQVEPNRTDDAKLLQQSLDNQAMRGLEVKRVSTDGGYTGPTGDAACEKHGVELRATRMRGGHSGSDRWGWERYTWEVQEDGTPIGVTCPQGCEAALLPGRATGRFIARFDAQRCGACPFFGYRCRVEQGKHVGPTLYVMRREIQVARRRQQLHPEDGPIRTLVESTIRSLKRAFPGSKLPVRGLIRARMMLYSAALMVNLRRLHRYSTTKVEKVTQEAVSFLSSLKSILCRSWDPIQHCFSVLPFAHDARATIVPPS
jgi:IS5 family transposase